MALALEASSAEADAALSSHHASTARGAPVWMHSRETLVPPKAVTRVSTTISTPSSGIWRRVACCSPDQTAVAQARANGSGRERISRPTRKGMDHVRRCWQSGRIPGRNPYPRPYGPKSRRRPRHCDAYKSNKEDFGWWVVLGSNQWPLPRETGRGLRIKHMRAESPSATVTCYHVMSFDITQYPDRTVPELSQLSPDARQSGLRRQHLHNWSWFLLGIAPVTRSRRLGRSSMSERELALARQDH